MSLAAHDRTRRWAIEAGWPEKCASAIAAADIGTDSGSTGPFPWQDGANRHFNIPVDGIPDSREVWAKREYEHAGTLCTAKLFSSAMGAIGRGLHSEQDAIAHGDWDIGETGMWFHPLWYDDVNYDGHGPNGVPMRERDKSWRDGIEGSERIAFTSRISRTSLVRLLAVCPCCDL